MTAAEIIANFTFASGNLGTGASGNWTSATQLNITINDPVGLAAIDDTINRPVTANIADIGGGALLYTTAINMTGDFGQAAPSIVSAKVTADKEITIVFSESVFADTVDFSDLQIAGGGTVQSIAGNGTITIIVTHSGTAC